MNEPSQTMRALVLEEYDKLSFREMPMPEYGSGDALVRVKACGICGSDVHGMDGSSGRRIPPLIMGHEASGVVESVGGDVADWKAGDRVTFDSTVYRQDDWYTRNGYYNLSEGREVLGVSTEKFKRHGAFAEFVAVPQHILHRLPDEVSFEHAAMVEPVAVALHALKLSQMEPDDVCVVVGAGMIGVFILQLLKIAGVRKVFVVDLSKSQRERAEKMGAESAFSPDDPGLSDALHLATDGRGADVAFEAVGIEPTVNLAIELLRKGGACVLVGNVAPEVRFPLQKVVTRQLKLQGSCAICGEYPAVLELLRDGKMDLDEFIAEVASLSEGADWFGKLKRGEVSGKVILTP